MTRHEYCELLAKDKKSGVSYPGCLFDVHEINRNFAPELPSKSLIILEYYTQIFNFCLQQYRIMKHFKGNSRANLKGCKMTRLVLRCAQRPWIVHRSRAKITQPFVVQFRFRLFSRRQDVVTNPTWNEIIRQMVCNVTTDCWFSTTVSGFAANSLYMYPSYSGSIEDFDNVCSIISLQVGFEKTGCCHGPNLKRNHTTNGV